MGAAFLDEADDRAQRDHDADHDRRLRIRAEPRQARENGQQEVERVQVAAPEAQPGSQRLLVRDLVGAGLLQAPNGLFGSEPAGVRLQTCDGTGRIVVRRQEEVVRKGRANFGCRILLHERREGRATREMTLRVAATQEGRECLGQYVAHRFLPSITSIGGRPGLAGVMRSGRVRGRMMDARGGPSLPGRVSTRVPPLLCAVANAERGTARSCVVHRTDARVVGRSLDRRHPDLRGSIR